MTQYKEPWERDPPPEKEYEGDFPPGHEPEPKEPRDDCGTGGSGPPDGSDPPEPDRIGGGPEDCRE